MLTEILTQMTYMLSSSPAAGVAGSFLWGMAGVILSPCHLAAIPLIVGYIDSQGSVKTGRAALIATLFSSGIFLTIAVIGILTGLAGRMLGEIGQGGNIIVALMMVIVGLYLIGIVPLPFLDSGINQPGFKRRGLFAAFLLGLIFGLALGPCTFAFMAPVLGVAFSVASRNLIFAVILVAAYAVGHCAVIIAAGTFTGAVTRVLKWNESSGGAIILKKVCGLLVVIAGGYMLARAL